MFKRSELPLTNLQKKLGEKERGGVREERGGGGAFENLGLKMFFPSRVYCAFL